RSVLPSIRAITKCLSIAFRQESSTKAYQSRVFRDAASVSRILSPNMLVQRFVVAALADLPIRECIEVSCQFGDDIAQLQWLKPFIRNRSYSMHCAQQIACD